VLKRRRVIWIAVAIALVLAAAFPLVFFRITVRSFSIGNAAMEPTLPTHDVVFAEMSAYSFSDPREGDIVVFYPPIESPNHFIKRIIGLPGDRLRLHNGTFYRNGVAMSEPYAPEKANYEMAVRDFAVWVDGVKLDTGIANVPPRDKWTAPDRIPPGCYWLVGDNRNNSEDSHVWGFMQRGGVFFSGPRAGEAASLGGYAFIHMKPKAAFL
jgi:signal peptidase I